MQFYLQLFVYTDTKNNISDAIFFPEKPLDNEVGHFDISIMATETYPYIDELVDCVQYYNQLITDHGLPASIYLAFFGENIPKEIEPLCTVKTFPLKDFSVPFGRNRSIEMCRAKHVFSIDIDKFFSIQSFKDIINYYTSLPNSGLLSVRRTKLDPASLFFNREKIMKAGLLCEEFTGMYCDDDEFLIHLSRKGIMPVVVHTHYHWVRNQQEINTERYLRNQKILREIILNGRKEYGE